MYARFLLPMSNTACGEAALRFGMAMARRWNAQLSAVIVRVDPRSVAPLAGEGLSGAMIEDLMESTERESAARVKTLEQAFHQALSASGARGVLETMLGRDEEIVPALARVADITILPHPSDDEASDSECLHAVLFDSGRPVLIAPPPDRAAEIAGTRCAVGWNGTPESASALAAALPWLREAEAVRILYAPEYQRHGPPASELLPYLALHGIRAGTQEFKPLNRDLGAGLLQAASDFEADLLVMGAYSHSRLRQMILGGVTRHVLAHCPIPVLMCH